jgi:CRP-like cAMP-binding protein
VQHRPYHTDPHPLVRKLESIVDLTAEERDAIRALPMMVRTLNADQDIVREGDRPSQCCLLIEGMLFRYRMLDEGRRQILAFHISGDVPDLQSIHLNIMDHSLASLGPATVGFVQHRDVLGLLGRCPRVAGALWRDTLIDAAIFREWMVGLGRRDAETRIAHLLCELYTKMHAVGLAKDHSAPMPITQENFADALGLSSVHVNRSIQELRAQNLIALSRKTLDIKNWERLAKVGEFDPTYLHLNPERRPAAAH